MHQELTSLQKAVSSLQTLCGDNIETVDNLQGFLGEVSDKINLNQEETEARIGAMTKAITAQKAILNGLETKAGEILQSSKNLKDSFTTSPTKVSSTNSPGSKSSGYSRPFECHECGEYGHLRPNCPKRRKLDFCPR